MIRFPGWTGSTASVVLVALLLGGCATTSNTGQRTSSGPGGTGHVYPPPTQQPGYPPQTAPQQQAPMPVPVPGSEGGVALAPPPVLPTYPKSAGDISGQAVVSLMKQASTARAAGQYDQALASLERAVRIDPRNYFVWSAMSQVYLDKKLYDNAESIAMKSNSLARGNVYVELENWKTIVAARQGQGDSIGALQAQSKADEIQRTLTGG